MSKRAEEASLIIWFKEIHIEALGSVVNENMNRAGKLTIC